MFTRTLLAMLFISVLLSGFVDCSPSYADAVMPEAPAFVSWLPHGYGATMQVNNGPGARMEGLHGFRPTPEYIGSWSYPLWGWDVNGYFRGPQVPRPDPVMCQLPIGLIYPANGPVPPPPGGGPRKPPVPMK